MYLKIRTFAFSLLLPLLFLSLGACTDSDSGSQRPLNTASTAKSATPGAEETPCGMHKEHPLFKGPKGGCYYYSDNGKKVYVDKTECNC